MEDSIMDKIIRALPDEGIKELNALIDNDGDEMQIIDLFEKYNVNVGEIMSADEVRELAKKYNFGAAKEDA